jgi:hypothetical protein
MQMPETAVTRAPLYFNFACDVVDRWARLLPDNDALWQAGF